MIRASAIIPTFTDIVLPRNSSLTRSERNRINKPLARTYVGELEANAVTYFRSNSPRIDMVQQGFES